MIEQLTDDWHNSLGNVSTTGALSEEKNEAPILFERKGTYYLLYGHTCCFCRQVRAGSDGSVATTTALARFHATAPPRHHTTTPHHHPQLNYMAHHFASRRALVPLS